MVDKYSECYILSFIFYRYYISIAYYMRKEAEGFQIACEIAYIMRDGP